MLNRAIFLKRLQNSPVDRRFSIIFLKDLSRNTFNDKNFDALVSFTTNEYNAEQ